MFGNIFFYQRLGRSKRFLISIVILFFSLSPLFSTVITVADFDVQTSEEKYRFVGKGISALLANKLRQSRAINLVEREKLNEIFKEHELSLSGVTQGEIQLGDFLDVILSLSVKSLIWGIPSLSMFGSWI